MQFLLHAAPHPNPLTHPPTTASRLTGLIGRNGTGKSTLLRAMSTKVIPGIPNNWQVLHVEQEVRGSSKSGAPGLCTLGSPPWVLCVVCECEVACAAGVNARLPCQVGG